ncbi:EI24 domain-containing protein [Herbiconiux liangxiaofengii]|uniref:EI24 domain-containing protein n=1 Tax=Herbiconiux liangxiaofengii TaxID=3342795 RepID=UPI0035BA4205
MISSFFSGVGLLGRGFGTWVRRPGLMLLGALPAFIVGLVYATGIVLLIVYSPAIADWATPFADRWDEPWRDIARAAASVALVGLGVLAVVFTYTAITLAVGDPFYERIWRSTEERLGDAPGEPPGGFWAQLGRGVVTALRLLALTLAIGLLLFVVGLIPLVGQVAAPVLGALFGGWVLALELTGFAFEARGIPLRERRRMLGANRAQTLGFGVATYLLFLLPLGAVVAMPAAVAGATHLARAATGPRPQPQRQA